MESSGEVPGADPVTTESRRGKAGILVDPETVLVETEPLSHMGTYHGQSRVQYEAIGPDDERFGVVMGALTQSSEAFQRGPELPQLA